MGRVWAHSQLFFSCPEKRHDKIKSAVSDACEEVGRCTYWEDIDPASKSAYAEEGEEWYLQYDSDDRHTDEVYTLVQERIPDITFRYVEAGMSSG